MGVATVAPHEKLSAPFASTTRMGFLFLGTRCANVRHCCELAKHNVMNITVRRDPRTRR